MYVGQKIRFGKEVQRYTVQACDDNFGVLTKPLNIHHTYLYTIVDLSQEIRGTCNWIFGMNEDVDNENGAAQALCELQCGDMAVSYRNNVPLSTREMHELSPEETKHKYHVD